MTEGWYVVDADKAFVAGPFGRKATASQWIEAKCPPRRSDPATFYRAYATYGIRYVREGVARPYKPQPTDADCRAATEAVAVLCDQAEFDLPIYGVLSEGLKYNAISPTSSRLVQPEPTPGLEDAVQARLIAWVENTRHQRWYLTDLGYLAACVMKQGFYAG
jgi:hypothetical protein